MFFAAQILLVISTVVSAELPANLHPILAPEFQMQVNRDSNSVLSVSDETKVLVNGTESYPERWRMLENAKHSIHFSTMYIFNDATTKRLADLLVRKKKEGVDVKIIVYGIYSTGNMSFYRRMSRNGIPVFKYSGLPDIMRNPLRFWLRHLHDKYLVVDGKEAITGGMNWSGRYERGGTKSDVAWRDTDILVTGKQAEVVEKEFEKRWAFEKEPSQYAQAEKALAEMYGPLMFPAEATYEDYIIAKPETARGYEVRGLTRFLYQQPYEQDGKAYITNFYKDAIDKAEKRVWWQSISVRPSDIQKKALFDAAKRGVDVRLVTNSRRNMHMLPIAGAVIYVLTMGDYRELLENGLRIFEYSGDAPMHAKGFLVDDALAVIGSYNATFTAEKYYTESAIAVYDTAAVGDVEKMFDADLACCKEVTIRDLDERKKAQQVTRAF